MSNINNRLLKAIRHQPIDRVPINLYGLEGLDFVKNNPTYKQLLEYADKFCEPTPEVYPRPNYENPFAEYKIWEDEVCNFTKTIFHTPKGDLSTVRRVEKNFCTSMFTEYTIKDIEDIDKYLSMKYEPIEPDMSEYFKVKQELGSNGIVMVLLYDPIGTAEEMIGMENLLYYSAAEKKKLVYFLEVLHERKMQELKMLLKHDVKDVIFRIAGAEILSPPNFSPDNFYEFDGRFLKDFCTEIKKAGGIPRIHSHGKVGRIMKYFIEAGVDAVDPFEPLPAGDIELSEVKRLYGKDICIFGNIEISEIENADKNRIDYLVKEAMEAAMDDSGFVFMLTASTIYKTLPAKIQENHIQMIESALKYGKY